jgi:hypothetical protein
MSKVLPAFKDRVDVDRLRLVIRMKDHKLKSSSVRR